MQTSTPSHMRFGRESINRRRTPVHGNHPKLDQPSRWQDAVATFSLALTAIILFALVYQSMVP
jgi:hypothetical protein